MNNKIINYAALKKYSEVLRREIHKYSTMSHFMEMLGQERPNE